MHGLLHGAYEGINRQSSVNQSTPPAARSSSSSKRCKVSRRRVSRELRVRVFFMESPRKEKTGEIEGRSIHPTQFQRSPGKPRAFPLPPSAYFDPRTLPSNLGKFVRNRSKRYRILPKGVNWAGTNVLCCWFLISPEPGSCSGWQGSPPGGGAAAFSQGCA